MSKTLQFKTDCKDVNGYVAQSKQQKINKVILHISTSIIESMCWQIISPFWFWLF